MNAYVVIGILLFLFIVYRMVKFHKSHGKVVIADNELSDIYINDDNTFETNYGKGQVLPNQQVFEFILVYKEFYFIGHYVFSEKLDNFSLQGFALQFDQLKSLEKGCHEFEYKLQSLKEEQPKFYFFVGFKKDNPFI